MTNDIQNASSLGSPDTADIQYCAWHQGPTDSGRLVLDAIGAAYVACRTCRRVYELPPAPLALAADGQP